MIGVKGTIPSEVMICWVLDQTWKKLHAVQAVLADILSEITLFFQGLFEPNIPFFLLRMEKEELNIENLG